MSDYNIGEEVFVLKVIAQSYGEDSHRARDEEVFLSNWIGKSGKLAGIDADNLLGYIVQFDNQIAGQRPGHRMRFRQEELAHYRRVPPRH